MEPDRAQTMGEADLEATVEVAVPPASVWSWVSDPLRTAEWSPVVQRSEWLGEPGPAVGARFRGHNRFNGVRWRRECEVTEAEPGRVFAFSTFGRDGREQTRWRYTLEPAGDATRVTLAYQVVTVPRWVRVARVLPGGRRTSERQARWNLDESLRRLRDGIEAQERRPA